MSHQTARIMKVFSAGLLFALLAVTGTRAQEKSLVWVSSTKKLTLPTGKLPEWFDQDNAVLYRSHALDLIKATVGGCIVEVPVKEPPGTPPSALASPCPKPENKEIKVVRPFPGPNDYVVIHVLRWKAPAPNSNAQSVDKQSWYVFHQGKIGKLGPDDWDDDAYAKNNRIFGSRNVYLLYIHFNQKSPYLVRYTMTAKKKTPAYLLHFFSLLQVYGMNKQGGGEGVVVPNAVWNAKELDSYYVPSDLTFAPAVLPKPSPTSAEIPANVPTGTGAPASPVTPNTAPDASVPTGASPSPSQPTPAGAPSAAAPAPTASPGGAAPPPAAPGSPTGTTSSELPPTSLKPPGNNPPAPPPNPSPKPSESSSESPSIPTEVTLDSQTFDNEGLYHIDFSVAVPIRKISEISYVSNSNTLIPTKIDKQTTFGVIDYYIKPVDIKNSGWSIYPHALAGVAIDSHPLKRVLIGGGYGPLLAHFYIGLVLDTQSLPPGASCGSIPTTQQLASGNLRNHVCPGLSLGLNVSVGSVLDSLKSKSSTGSGSKAK
jgi:hypothetical protein